MIAQHNPGAPILEANMANEVATIQPRRDMATVLNFSSAQVDLIKRTIAVGCTDDELELFVQVCRSKRLDPFSRQIHAVKRWDSKQKREVMAIQVGIDGYRLQAARTGLYQGQDPIQWCDEHGEWHDVWLSDGPPAAARCTIYRRGFERGITAVAKFSSYCARGKEGQPIAMWRTMPEVMIGKCAEALAIRKAFPDETSGTVSPEEMDHDHENVVHYGEAIPEQAQPAHAQLPPATGPITRQDIELLRKEVKATATQLELDPNACWGKMLDYAKRVHAIEKWSDLDRNAFDEVFDAVALELSPPQEPTDGA